MDEVTGAAGGGDEPTTRRVAPAGSGDPVSGDTVLGARETMGDDAASMLGFRRELYRRFGPSQVAVSADGREVRFMAPVEAGLGVGGFAVVLDDQGGTTTPLVVQIIDLRLAERVGPELSVAMDVDTPEAHISAATVRPLLRALDGAGAVLGTLEGTELRRGTAAPFGERFIRPATATEIDVIVAGLDQAGSSVEIGVVRQAPQVPVRLRSKGFARHTFMCGQSGSGKTYTTGALFERLLTDTTLPIAVLDPNSDHVLLDRLRDAADGSDAASRFKAVSTSVRVARARGFDSSITLCADYSDLDLDWQALLLRLHPIADADEFDALRRITSSLSAPYSAADVMEAARAAGTEDPLAGRVLRRFGNLGIADWDVWRRDDEKSIASLGMRHERCVVFDLGSLSRPDERTTVALVLLGRLWGGRAVREPVLIAVDEAHNVFPTATDDPLLQATADLGALIAGEGRKFGLHLFVATQRPSKVHPNVVSQCDNLVLMRMNGARDVEDLVTLFSHVPAALLREALGFGLGEALFAGPISPTPMLAKVGTRLSAEGGGDIPTTWASPGVSPAT